MKVESGDGYGNKFPEMFKLLNTLLVLPIGRALVQHSFSQRKLVKTRLRSILNGCNLARLMRVAEGLKLVKVAQNHRIQL